MDFDVQKERVAVEGVVVHHYPGNVPQDLQDQPADHADHESPCAVVYAETDVRQEHRREEDGKEEVGAIAWSVLLSRYTSAALHRSPREKGYTYEER